MPTKYKGNKPLNIIERNVKANDWHWNQSGLEQGGDWVNFEFVHDNISRNICYNTFNGSFLTKDKPGNYSMITERHHEFDNVPWYVALMDFIYEPLEGVVAA